MGCIVRLEQRMEVYTIEERSTISSEISDLRRMQLDCFQCALRSDWKKRLDRFVIEERSAI